MKVTITFVQFQNLQGETEYRVTNLKNTIAYKIGERMSKDKVGDIILHQLSEVIIQQDKKEGWK